jgi:ribosomal protein S18 acetylase RimI-like enzyme
MRENRYIYEGGKFENIDITPINYKPEFFNLEIELESEVFYDIRKLNNILPYRLKNSSEKDLNEIKGFFEKYRSSFFFLFDNDELIGSILIIRNYIQSLSIAKNCQGKGFGAKLSKYAINYILNKGYRAVELNVLHGNVRAHNLYTKLGFKIIK